MVASQGNQLEGLHLPSSYQTQPISQASNSPIVISKHKTLSLDKTKLSAFEESILHAKPSDKPEPDHSKTAWPKQEATVLVEWKETPANPAQIRRVPISTLKAWQFYGFLWYPEW